jgi:hypothetical protein
MQTEKFVGPKKVDVVVVDDFKTYGNNDVVTVHYTSGDKEFMPKRTFELVVTDEPSDYTKVRAKKYAEIRKEIYPIMGEYVSFLGAEESVRAEKKTEMLQKCLAAISEIDMTDAEMEPFFNQVIVEFNMIVNAVLYELSATMGRAVNFLWTKDDSKYIPGSNPMDDRTFLESKKITDSIPKTEKKSDEEQPATTE